LRITDFRNVDVDVAEALSTAWCAHFGCQVLPNVSSVELKIFRFVVVTATWADGEVEASVRIGTDDWLNILDGDCNSFDGDEYSACDGIHASTWSFDGTDRGTFTVEFEDGGTAVIDEPFSSLSISFES